MKKSFVVLLALVLLVSGTACYAQNALLKEKDQVHFEEMFSYGDKSVVEGVTVEMYSEYLRNLFWHTTYTMSENPKEETEHEVYSLYQTYYEDKILGNFMLITGTSDAFVMGYMEEDEYFGLQAAMKELYDQTGPGEEKIMTINLKDYEEYYNLGMELQLPREGEEYVKYSDFSYYFIEELEKEIATRENSSINYQDLPDQKKMLKDLKNFNEFFKIPVIEDEIYTIGLRKNSEGQVIGTAISGANGGGSSGDMDFIQIPDDESYDSHDSYNFSMYCEFDNGECLMTFDPKTIMGKTVDTSLIPGGFGIYRFTYDSTKGTIDSEHIEMVYALDPELEITEFRLDASKKNLLIKTVENGRQYLSVIDRATMTFMDKFDIGSEDVYSVVYCLEDYLVTACDTIAVYPLNAEAHYEKAFEVESAPIIGTIEELVDSEELAWYFPGLDGSFDWNGETLLMGWYNRYNREGDKCEFTLAAIDKTGLVYYGSYQSTLCTYFTQNEMVHDGNNCRPDSSMQAPVIVHWAR